MILTRSRSSASSLLGAASFFAVRRLPDSANVSVARLRRFVEVEFGCRRDRCCSSPRR
jgi:hypothetical protein